MSDQQSQEYQLGCYSLVWFPNTSLAPNPQALWPKGKWWTDEWWSFNRKPTDFTDRIKRTQTSVVRYAAILVVKTQVNRYKMILESDFCLVPFSGIVYYFMVQSHCLGDTLQSQTHKHIQLKCIISAIHSTLCWQQSIAGLQISQEH